MSENIDKKLKSEFDNLLIKVKNGDVAKKPSIADKLKLYAWYKQALFGDIKADAPSGVADFTEKMKHDAWSKVKGMDKSKAMSLYIAYFK